MAVLGGFKWGSKVAPIIKEYTLEGDYPVALPDLDLSDIDLREAFELGQPIGYAYNGEPPGGQGPVDPGYYDNIRTLSFLQMGSTFLHDAMEVTVGPDTLDPAYDPKRSTHSNSVNLMVNNSSVDYANMGVAPGYQTYTPYIDEDWTHVVAIRYRWPDALVDSQKTAGYLILYIGRELRTIGGSGEVYSDDYATGSSFFINIPYRNMQYDKNAYYEELPPPDPEDPYEPSEPEVINPTIDDSSDTITIPSDPTVGVTSAGFINVYHPSANALRNFGDIIFPNVASATDIVEAVIKLCETLANQNLINYVIDCHILPISPVDGTNAEIKVGFRNTGITVPRVASDYVNISCGSLQIPEYFGAFADYLTRGKLYLPFIGYIDLKPEFWQSGTLYVDYKFNVIDGSFMAYVRSSSSKSQLRQSIIGCYSGNACMHLPLTGVNYSNMVSGIIGAAVAAETGGTATAALGAAYSAANTIAAGGNPQQSNGYNSTAAILGVRTPFLQIERPVISWPETYRHDKGMPSNISTQLSNVSGFTTIENIDLSGLPFTEGEINELRSLLTEGVYF